MEPFRDRQQRIIATGLVRADEKILLVRSNQVQDSTFAGASSYFDVPRLLIRFGEDPATRLAAFCEACTIKTESFHLLDVQQYLSPDSTTHVFEMIYTTTTEPPHSERLGRLLFATPEELAHYILHSERTRIERYLT